MSHTERRPGAGRFQRGQATTETILVTWIMVAFFATMYQLFLVNHTIYRSLAAVHQQVFEQGFPHNCLDEGAGSGGLPGQPSSGENVFSLSKDRLHQLENLLDDLGQLLGIRSGSTETDFCRYQTDPHAHAYVVWSAQDIPEIQVQVVGLLKTFGLTDDPLLIQSNLNRDGDCPTCKTTQMGAGPEGPGDHVEGLARFFAKAAWAVGWSVSNLGNILQWEQERVGG
ncbi:MAG TPA: hypothetical protein VEL75_20580 [Candidatus Methylomirabilis sp.]|nr:hypothetical protein [Candidatus Methylomirabilis sp.]